uniref:Serine/threonine-protein kinase TOR n=1 Tax=Leersia perrieri TaxID=77586 RepID=A0A0D9WFJ7_9ORYZ
MTDSPLLHTVSNPDAEAADAEDSSECEEIAAESNHKHAKKKAIDPLPAATAAVGTRVPAAPAAVGIMGALDPLTHKLNQLKLPGQHMEVLRPTLETAQYIVSMEELQTDFWPSFSASVDYYSTVAISSLTRILHDPSLSSYHQMVVGSLIFIFKSMGLGCVPYLPKVLPELFRAVHKCEDGSLKEIIMWKLGTLVSIVRQHIRKYLQEILSLVSELWTSSFSLPAPNRTVQGPQTSPVLHLVEQLCLALNDEFRMYVLHILPSCIQVLGDAERCNDYYYVPDILHTLEVFGGNLDEQMHLVTPVLVRLFQVELVDIRRRAIVTLTKLLPSVQVGTHVSVLVNHLKLVLDGNNNDLRKDAAEALCCLAHARGEDFTIFVPSIHKLLVKHHLQYIKWDEIENRLLRREPLISENSSVQKYTQCPPDVISDPLDDFDGVPSEEADETQRQRRTHQVNDFRLRSAGEASQRSTREEDWAEWMRHFSIALLEESPSPALRTCVQLALLQPSVGRKLFAAGFASCWAQMNETSQEQLVRSLKTAFSSQNIPPEILATLLNLAEFMEHDEKPLPIDTRLLGALAEKCRAFVKALHYKEMEFEAVCSKKMGANPVTVVESLIHINNQLHQHEAAIGILTYSQQHLEVQLKESWYEKLHRWDEALKAYKARSSQAPGTLQNLDATLGRMRCLAALARWEDLSSLCREQWTASEPSARLEMAPMVAANAAWHMGEWDQMAEYVSRLDDGDENKIRILGNTTASGDGSSNGAIFRSVLSVRCKKYDEARVYVERAQRCLATELAALVLESYERAYNNMVRVQQLSELEEVIDYCTLPRENPIADSRRELIRNMWNERTKGTKRNVEVWQALLAVRELVLPPNEDRDTWIKFAKLCWKSGRISQAKSTLVKLLQFDPESYPKSTLNHAHRQVVLAYLKCQYAVGDETKRRDAFCRLQDLSVRLATTVNCYSGTLASQVATSNAGVPLSARVYLTLGSWKRALSPGLDDDSIQEILVSYKNATLGTKDWGKAWHLWALFNTEVMSRYILRGRPDIAEKYVVAAVTGYFYSIACASTTKGVDDSLQDILRLLTLGFNHGATSEVQMALQKGFSLVKIEMWLVVLPQIIARIHSNNKVVRELIQSLLVRIGKDHPQALMYPLLVACKSVSILRQQAAQDVVDKIRQHSGGLVDQAQLVSKELIRVAILWHEMWHEALEEASRLYFGEHNIEGMLAALEPLHKMLEKGPETIKENAFFQAYGNELLEAHECCLKYRATGEDAELTKAWDLYYSVFKRIDKQLPSLTTLDLQSVSPELLQCPKLELAVPGTYSADAPLVTIEYFVPQLIVITSKQRPRKLTMHGSDGNDYAFLLKGHEDLRQDERVMQLFGLVNTLLENSRKTSEKDLSIQRYAVIPLCPNSGLIGWVPNCDTLHALIREYRDAKKIPLNQEHRLMLGFAPDYDHLPLIVKVEVFQYALENTEGNDLAKVLWLKSRTSEVWLERRTNYTRSLAVMSMEIGIQVPFRLTRMHVKAMEVSGIEGTFRTTCENVMQVLRTNKDSVMAMMEASVHDPLINWRLFNFNEVPQVANSRNAQSHAVVNSEEAANLELMQPPRRAREKELLQVVNQLDDANEVLNKRAVAVMARMSHKLTGRDFSSGSLLSGAQSSTQHGNEHSDSGHAREGLSVKVQLQKLILQAMSHENLCQHYIGWCPFW